MGFSITDEKMNDIIYIVVFLILFAVIRKVLKEQILLEKGSPIISLCVSLLCVVGMQRVFTASKGSDFHPMLVPYAALGISILFMLLLMLIGKLPKKGKPRKEERRTGSKPGSYGKSGSDRIRKV